MNKNDVAYYDYWLWLVASGEKKAWASCFSLFFPWHFLALYHCPVLPTNLTFQRPSCVHDISAACNDSWNTTECPAAPTSRGVWWLSILHVLLKPRDASPKCCHPLGSCAFFLPFEQTFLSCGLFSFGCCVLFSTRIWLCLTPGEFPLLG